MPADLWVIADDVCVTPRAPWWLSLLRRQLAQADYRERCRTQSPPQERDTMSGSPSQGSSCSKNLAGDSWCHLPGSGVVGVMLGRTGRLGQRGASRGS